MVNGRNKYYDNNLYYCIWVQCFVSLIGYIASKRIKVRPIIIWGKSAGPVLTAFRFASTFESGSMMVGVPGLGYKFGYVTYNQGFLGPLGYFFSFRVFGQRVKVACDHYDSITVPDLLERHYKSPALKTVGSIAIIIGLTGSIIAQLKAMGEVFSALLNLKYTHGVLIGLVIIAVYKLLGGYLGNAFANVAQGVLMVGGSIILLSQQYCLFQWKVHIKWNVSCDK